LGIGASGGASPTVLLNAAYATDTIVDDGAVPIANGNPVDSWTFTTGGEFNYTLANLAGASARPQWIAASGVHTNGTNAALTCATPITIPADTDCVIYVKANLGALESGLNAIGGSTNSHFVSIGTSDGDGDHSANIEIGGGNDLNAVMTGKTTTGVYLLRFTRASGVWLFACTGVASAAMAPTGTVSGAISFNTLLGYGGGTLSSFSSPGMYLQKLKIWSGTSDPDTVFEAANGGAL